MTKSITPLSNIQPKCMRMRTSLSVTESLIHRSKIRPIRAHTSLKFIPPSLSLLSQLARNARGVATIQEVLKSQVPQKQVRSMKLTLGLP